MDRPAALRWSRLTTWLTLAVVMVVSTGCSSAIVTAVYLLRGREVPGDYEGLKGKKVAVVCRPLVGLAYRDSHVAQDLSRRVGLLLKRNVKKIEIVEQSKVESWIDEHSWEEYTQVGKAVKADMVVGIDLEHFNIYEGQTVYQGKARVGVKVYDCQKKELAFEKQLPQVVYPPNHVVSAAEVQEADFRKEFLAVLADYIGVLFYRHDPYAHFAMDAMALQK